MEQHKNSIKAVYDPNRMPDGKFVKGNTLRQGAVGEVSKRFAQLRSMWFDTQSIDDMDTVKRELIQMCKSCPVPDVKLRAIIYYLDRTLGRPTERVEMEVSPGGGVMPAVELSAEEIAVLEKLVVRTEEDAPLVIEAGE